MTMPTFSVTVTGSVSDIMALLAAIANPTNPQLDRIEASTQRIETLMAQFDDDITALTSGIADVTAGQATLDQDVNDAATRVGSDFAKLTATDAALATQITDMEAQIATLTAGQVTPAQQAAIEAATAQLANLKAAQAATQAKLVALDPTPVVPPPPTTIPGTVTVTTGSANVVGVGTTFTTTAVAGKTITFTGDTTGPYTVGTDPSDSDTSLTLTAAYTGAPLSGVTATVV